MPVTYLFCPLCFKKLDRHESVYVSRPSDRNKALDREKLPPEEKCDKLSALIAEDEKWDPENGIFLAHKGCTRLNPFCKHNGTLPSEGNDKFTIEFGGGSLKRNEGIIPDTEVKVSHYEVGLLKCMSPKLAQMWFPAALLKVTTALAAKPGCVVVLAGATGVGKTILSLQSMHSDGFENILNADKINVNPAHFAYAPAPVRFADCVNSIENLLQPSEALDSWVQEGTVPELGELRAIFYRSSAPRKKEAHAGEVVEGLKSVIFGDRQKSQPSRWRTVIFYDAAGEHFEEKHLQELEELYEVTDNMAVVVEAASFLKCSDQPRTDGYRRWDRVAKVAHEHIERIQRRSPEQQPRWCLVVTKVDQIKDRIDESLWKKVEHFAELATKSKSGVPDEWGEPLDLLCELAGDNVVGSRRKLLKQLSAGGDQPSPEIFFVWTDGLDVDDGVRILPGTGGEVPTSYGLGKFIAWCLNDDLKVINFAKTEPPRKGR